MDSSQLVQAGIWSGLGLLCAASIVWGATRRFDRRPPGMFYAVQSAFAMVCFALAAHAVSVAALPQRVPAYVDALLGTASADPSVQPAALSADALAEFESARSQVRGPVRTVVSRVMPTSRSLMVTVTFGNRDVMLLSLAYRDTGPAWLPLSVGPYRLFVESTVFLPHHSNPNAMVAVAHPEFGP